MKIKKSFLQFLLMAMFLVISVGAVSAAEELYIDFQLVSAGNINVAENNGDDRDFAGGIWISPSGDVLSEHLNPGNPDMEDTPLDENNLPEDANGHIAAMWKFEITDSSGDNWDAVLSGGEWQFNISWEDGKVLWTTEDGAGSPVSSDMKEVFFSHIGENSLGQWVNNNNQESTPGEQVENVWTYLSFEETENLYRATGYFAVIAEDSEDVMGLLSIDDTSIEGLDPESNGEWATYIGVSGTGKLTAKDATVPILEEVSPSEGLVELFNGQNLVLTVDASDLGGNLYELEIDHSMEDTLEEFSQRLR